jgi:hypothetical protein
MVTAGAMLIWPVQTLYSVKTVDFARQQKQDLKRFKSAVQSVAKEAGMNESPDIQSPDNVPLEEYIAKETEGRLIDVSGAQWIRLYDETAQTLSGKSTVLAGHLEREFTPDHLFFAVDSQPLSELAGRLDDKQRFTYVRIGQDNTARYMSVTFVRSGDALGHAPGWLVFPQRPNAVWVFILSLALYLFLPWHRQVLNELRYGQLRSVVLPDILGVLLTCAFVLLPILVIPRNASSDQAWHLLDFSAGWGFLTLFMWFMALGGLSIIVIVLWYATFSLFVMPDRIRRVTLLGEKEYPFSDMTAVEPAVWALPRWFRLTMLFFGLFNWRLMGAVLLGTMRSAAGIAIRMRDSRTVNVWMEHLQQGERLLMALRANNIPMPPEMAAVIPAKAPVPAQSGTAKGMVAAVAAFVVLAGLALALALRPDRIPVVKPPEPVITIRAYKERQAILKEISGLRAEMEATLEEMKKLPVDKSGELQKKYDEQMDRFNKLRDKFEEWGKDVEQP